MHPSARLRLRKSSFLRGKRIVLGVTGSIAAVESVRIAHELIRHGADVVPVMSKAAAAFVGPAALQYATGHPPILELSGAGEHVALLDRSGSADLLLVAPATANTLAKIALGIDDTPVTTCATVALGAGKPVLVAPAMHEAMGAHPAIQQRLKDLERLGVRLVAPRREEEKAKIADPETIAQACVHALARGPLAGKKVLVISGATAEPVDPIRVVTNRSSGRMGVELAAAAYRRGAEVHLWNAWGLVALPDYLAVRRFETVEDLLRLVRDANLEQFAAILMPAALSDFAPVPVRDKISADGGKVRLEMRPLPKVITTVRKRAPDAVLVAFKAESKRTLVLPRSRLRLREYGADLVVGNSTDAFGAAKTRAVLVPKRGRPRTLAGTKAEVAEGVVAAVGALVGG